MNAPVTRRALLGATAAAGAIALPAMAEVRIPAADSYNPDAELLRLLDAWATARAAFDAAGDRAVAIWSIYLTQEPPLPEALLYRGDDGLNCGFEVQDLPDGRRAVVYGSGQISTLMAGPLPANNKWEGKPAPWDPTEQVGRWVQVPDERRIARRAEVLAAHHDWVAQCTAIRDRLGYTQAETEEEEACDELQAIEATILATAPLTITGLAAKARWASGGGLSKFLASECHKQITADVVAMVERGGVPS